MIGCPIPSRHLRKGGMYTLNKPQDIRLRSCSCSCPFSPPDTAKCHFDRSGSRPHRERRSGEIRFSDPHRIIQRLNANLIAAQNIGRFAFPTSGAFNIAIIGAAALNRSTTSFRSEAFVARSTGSLAETPHCLHFNRSIAGCSSGNPFGARVSACPSFCVISDRSFLPLITPRNSS